MAALLWSVSWVKRDLQNKTTISKLVSLIQWYCPWWCAQSGQHQHNIEATRLCKVLFFVFQSSVLRKQNLATLLWKFLPQYRSLKPVLSYVIFESTPCGISKQKDITTLNCSDRIHCKTCQSIASQLEATHSKFHCNTSDMMCGKSSYFSAWNAEKRN